MSLAPYCRIDLVNGSYLVVDGTPRELLEEIRASNREFIELHTSGNRPALFRPSDVVTIYQIGP